MAVKKPVEELSSGRSRAGLWRGHLWRGKELDLALPCILSETTFVFWMEGVSVREIDYKY